jgi:hypothetical protein
MADDQDLALAAPVFKAELGAFLAVELPWRRCALQHNGDMHLVAQFLDLWVAHGLSFLVVVFAPALPADREAVALQGRAERAGALRQPLAARSALAVAIPLSLAFQAHGRWREQEMGGG